jgi:hypothetical protein
MISLLVELGDDVQQVDKWEKNPLYDAVKKDNKDMEEFLEDCNKNLDKSTDSSRRKTPSRSLKPSKIIKMNELTKDNAILIN